MAKPASKSLAPEILARLPEALRSFIARGETRIETDDGDWEVAVKEPAPYLARYLPPGAVLIANNGVGDHLFLVCAKDLPEQFGPRVHVYWHEGPELTVLAEDVASLVAPPPPRATTRPPVYYHDGQTAVQLGDEVTARSFFRRRTGRVVYVPGLSKRNRDMEHHGLGWVGIKFAGGGRIGTVVDPDTSRLKKSVHFVQRSSEPFEEMGPQERFD